jgi:hypothetical protein
MRICPPKEAGNGVPWAELWVHPYVSRGQHTCADLWDAKIWKLDESCISEPRNPKYHHWHLRDTSSPGGEVNEFVCGILVVALVQCDT